jgi:hypothetical protein
MNIIKNTCTDKKDVVKAGNTTTMFKDVIGDTLTITGVIIYEKEEEGEQKRVSAVKLSDGSFISSISKTIANSLENLLGVYEDEEVRAGIEVIVKSKTSNGGRDFLYIDVA